jgi:hypothetical protein
VVRGLPLTTEFSLPLKVLNFEGIELEKCEVLGGPTPENLCIFKPLELDFLHYIFCIIFQPIAKLWS